MGDPQLGLAPLEGVLKPNGLYDLFFHPQQFEYMDVDNDIFANLLK